MRNIQKRKKGFTLIELIIVIAIIGILAAIAVPKYAGIQNDAKTKADIASAKVIADAAATLYAQGTITQLARVEATISNVSTLGSTPTVKAKYTSLTTPKFYVSVGTDGVVNVYVDTSATATANVVTLYPAP